MKESGDGDLKIAISDTFLNMVEQPVAIWSNRQHQARRIGLFTLSQEVLMVDRGRASQDSIKKRKSGKSDPISFISA